MSDSPDPSIIMRLATSPEDIEASQALRYKVFYEEQNAKPTPEMAATKRDFDEFDDIADHMLAIDENAPGQPIIGTYRMLRSDAAKKHGRFYSSDEYNLGRLIDYPGNTLELGRSCVLPAYRTRPTLQLLWEGIAGYVMEHKIEILFGCASLPGTDIDALKTQLSYLYHHHRAASDYRPRALEGRYVDMNLMPLEEIDAKRAFASLPPLLKGYLRVGGVIGDGAVIDEQFNTTDVCLLVETAALADRYRKHYERKTQGNFTTGALDPDMQKTSTHA